MRRGGRSAAAVAKIFAAAGGRFLTKPVVMAGRLAAVRALLFDWDGVFTDGRGASGFAEADSMGANLLRFGFWLRDGRLPPAAIVSGRENPAALEFADREHFHAVYTGVGDKLTALGHLRDAHRLSPDQVAAVFDDVNDLGVARECGVRILVHRPAGPLFRRAVAAGKLCDYVTANEGSRCAVREAAELMLGLMGMFEAVTDARVAFNPSYREYLAQRQSCVTERHAMEDGRLVKR
ncbi:MAG TPA: phosphatase [Planctomycetota bacterium]|nr:phosphatase [Planctomycetota bacterium]